MNDADDSTLSVQDQIIVVSLKSITGKDAEDVKDLFMNASIYAEDQRYVSETVLSLSVCSFFLIIVFQDTK